MNSASSMSDSSDFSAWSDVFYVSTFTFSFSSSRERDLTEVRAFSVISSSVVFTVVFSLCVLPMAFCVTFVSFYPRSAYHFQSVCERLSGFLACLQFRAIRVSQRRANFAGVLFASGLRNRAFRASSRSAIEQRAVFRNVRVLFRTFLHRASIFGFLCRRIMVVSALSTYYSLGTFRWRIGTWNGSYVFQVVRYVR